MFKNKPEKIILHCSDSPDGKEVSRLTLQSWHRQRGFSDIGYHFIIQPDGFVMQGRALIINGTFNPGAHCAGENHDSVGICLIGQKRFSLKQFQSLRVLIQNMQVVFDIPEWELYGHYEFDTHGKTCPNMKISHLVYWLLFDTIEPIANYLIKGD